MAANTLYILYNADASIMGKLKYGYRKICKSTEENPACAACDITHGGLSLQETPSWVDTKMKIEAESGWKVVQWHKDEISPEMKACFAEKNVRYPAVVARKGGGLEVIMDSSELTAFKGDAQKMLEGLRQKGFMQQKQASL